MAARVTLSVPIIFDRLDTAYDYASWHWQPDTPPDLICIGAILVQHTQWSNVELALERLRNADALSLAAVHALPEDRLAALVRPAGTPTIKAKRLRALAQLAHDHGALDALLGLPTDGLRPLLLATPGIGPETADAILLYAAGRPIFEIDAYTIRIFRRLGLGPSPRRTAGRAETKFSAKQRKSVAAMPSPTATANDYHTWQRWFEDNLSPTTTCSLPRIGEGSANDLYRRYHALIVLHGKHTCRPKPLCTSCCLLDICPTGQPPVT